MTRTYAHYTYTITNKVSRALGCILVVTFGSLLIKVVTPDGYDYMDILKHFAWPVWMLPFLYRLVEWLSRRTP